MPSDKTTERRARISLAHEIATKLWDAGYREAEGVAVLAMALGIYMEAQEGAHCEFRPLIEGMLRAAQMTYDAFQQRHEAGHA